jgi:ribonuclease P protein component
MKKREIVKDNRLFNSIMNEGNKLKNKYLILYYNKVETIFPKFGIAVGKKVGNAVTRNKYKRKIRAIVDSNKLLFPKNYNYIIIVRNESLSLNHQELSNNLIELIEKVK